MSKKIAGYENYRVIIEPRRLGDFVYYSVSDYLVCPDLQRRQQQYKERCDEIASEVRRHVDNVGSVEVVCDSIEVCEHCGAEWTEQSKNYNGGCCDADQKAYEENQSAIGE